MTLTTVYLGDHTLGVVSGRPTAKGVELTHSGSAALPADYADRDATGRTIAIREALAKIGGDVKSCVLIIPRPLAILRTFVLPAGSPEELRRMIGFQLEKDLPIPLDQLRYSYVLVTDPDGRCRVSAVAVPIEALAKLQLPLENAGCKIVGAVVSSFGLPHLLSTSSRDGSSLVINLADQTAEIAIIDGSTVSLSRTSPQSDSEGLATEIDRAILSHSASSGAVQRVLVAGEDDSTRQMSADLIRLLGRPVEHIVPNGIVTKRPDVKISSDLAAAAGVCVGLIRSRDSMPDVLRPPVIRRTYRVTKTWQIAIAVAVVTIGLIVAAQVSLNRKRNELERLQKRLAEIKPQADKVTKAKTDLAAVNQWMDQRFAWIDLFDALRSKLETGKMYFTKIDTNDTGHLRVEGRATDDKAVTQFVTELQKLKHLFREVVSDNITTIADPGAFKKDFAIRISITGMGKAPKK